MNREDHKDHKGAQADPETEVGNKQVLADVFRNLARYALLKTKRDVVRLGVTPDKFSVEAVDKSLAAPSNAGFLGEENALSLAGLLERAYLRSFTFHFYWEAAVAPEGLEAAFELSYEPDGDLKVRVLWLCVPELIPISPRVGVVDGRRPLEEAVTELVRVTERGRLSPYPAPEAT